MNNIIKFDFILRCILGGTAAIILLAIYIKSKKGDHEDGRNTKSKED